MPFRQEAAIGAEPGRDRTHELAHGLVPGGQVAEVAALEQVDHLGQLSVHVDAQAFPMAGTRAVDRIAVALLGVWNEVARNGPPDA